MNFETLFNQYLQKAFAKTPSSSQKLLKKSLLYTLKAKASRFRPQLCFETTKALGQNPKKILPWAIAIEMIHTGSLIHDDMPCMDDAKTRRGKSCNHLVFGESFALLAGTCLFIESFALLKAPVFNKKRVQLMELLNSNIGFNGLISGQAIDLKNKSPSQKELLNIMELKTSSLISACVLGPSLLYAKSSQQKIALKDFAKNLGLTYQLADDFQDKDGVDNTWLSQKGISCLNKSLKALKVFGTKAKGLEALCMKLKNRFA